MIRWWLLAAVVLSCGWAALGCPGSCSCRHEQGLYVANCSSLPFSGGKVEALTLLPSSQSPLELIDGQFNLARHLKYLSLRNSSIYFVHKKAFYGAKSVIEIDLSFNYIEELEPTVFQHLTSLATLILRGNPIKFVSEVPFLISNSLQHLDIGQCRIRTVPRGIFYGLKRLKYLSLDGNLLKSLKYNSLPKGLKYINLSQNLIVNVPTEVLSALTNLRRIGLSGNPINCSCSLMNLQDWLSGRGVIFEDDVTCDLPTEYHGISWSRVDENMLCLAEARREEISHSTIYNPLFKNKLYRGNYFENENSYLGEKLQSDQPQTLIPDSQAEVLFQNDETIAMGEMMRDEENPKEVTEKDQRDQNKDDAVESDVESAVISKIDGDIKPLESQDTVIVSEKPLDEETEKSVLSQGSDLVTESHDGISDPAELNLHDDSLVKDDVEGTKVEDSEFLVSHKNDVGVVDTSETSNNSSSTFLEKNISLTKEEHNEDEKSEADVELTHAVNLNESTPVEYKALNEEESNTELDDFKKEGLFHVESDGYGIDTNNTSEEPTALPDIEDTTEYEVSSTERALTVDVAENADLDEGTAQNVSSTTETNNGTIFDDSITYSEEEMEETEPPPVVIPDLQSTIEIQQNTSETVVPSIEIKPSVPTDQDTNLENNTLMASKDNKEEKVKQVAGAEVVMFCVAVLIICLILFSVYKCRTSKNRQNKRIVKDMESNRGTEMQDMASLLPKPQDDDKKNNLKYPDKAPPSETVKLISNKNEKDSQHFTPISENKSIIENKNSLNNNTPSSPTSKTPLIQPTPGKPITINPAAPIQRTKVKVGIIPDSIPRTPIFLQKTYNGPKNV